MAKTVEHFIEYEPWQALQTLDRLACEQSQLEFTKTFFAIREGAPFKTGAHHHILCLLYTSPSPRDKRQSRMPSSA